MKHNLRSQNTIQQNAVVDGFGYWSGRDIRLEFRPAAPNTGIVFVRGDLDPACRIEATVANRIEQPRRTTLSAGGVNVEMVEHILAALAGLQIDNCEVWADAAEMPGCDGSSLAFVEALDAAGIVKQKSQRSQLIVGDTMRVTDGDCWVEARPARRSEFKLKYRLDYGNDNAIGRQTMELPVTPASFRKELASARTFLLEEEANWLRAQGLGARVTAKDVLVFGDLGPIDNELRFEDECVRHKTLDMVGDFALAGCDIVGHIIAHRSGHRLNAELVRVLLAESQIIDSGRAA